MQHAAMPNTSGADRQAVIMGWQANAAAPMLRPQHISELEETGRMTDTLRRLVGAPGGEASRRVALPTSARKNPSPDVASSAKYSMRTTATIVHAMTKAMPARKKMD